MRPERNEHLARLVGLEQFVRLGKRGIISGMAAEGQVSQLFVTAVFLGVFCGCLPSTPDKTAVTQVTGASMSPTIWGESVDVSCAGCNIRWRANWQAKLRPQHPFPCWNCGNPINPPSASAPAASHNHQFSKYELGDRVTIDGDAYRDSPPQFNDIVVIGTGDQIRIKRIVGTPGDVISSNQSALLRNQEPIASDAPWIMVHDDRYRLDGKSWWTAGESLGSTAIMQTEAGFQITLPPSESHPPSAWLIYQHYSPYNGLRTDRVGDDYPVNLNESRSLRPVESLGLQITAQVTQEAKIRCWLWKKSSSLCHEQTLAPGIHKLRIRWQNRNQHQSLAERDASVLDSYRPIGIEIINGALALHDLKIERPIVYTIDETNKDSIPLPLELLQDQFFVVGDNVPLSIDSRHEGAVHLSEIVGRVRMPPTKP